MGAEGAHLKLTLRQGGRMLGGIAFSQGALARDASGRGGRGVQPGAQHLPWGDVAAAGRQGAQTRARGGARRRWTRPTARRAGRAGGRAGRCVFHAGRKTPFGYRIHTGNRLARAEAALRRGGAAICLVARTHASARRALALADMDVCAHAPGRSPRLCHAADRAGAAGDRGALAARMAAGRRGVSRVKRRCGAARLPHARVHVLPCSEALAALARAVDAGDEAYRTLYRARARRRAPNAWAAPRRRRAWRPRRRARGCTPSASWV